MVAPGGWGDKGGGVEKGRALSYNYIGAEVHSLVLLVIGVALFVSVFYHTGI
jgi:hypothetical protein